MQSKINQPNLFTMTKAPPAPTLESALNRLIADQALIAADGWLKVAIASKPASHWSPVEAMVVYRKLADYSLILHNKGIEYRAIERPYGVSEEAIASYVNQVTAMMARATKPTIVDQAVKKSPQPRLVEFKKGQFNVHFDYRAELVEQLRAIPTSRYRPELNKIWTVNCTSAAARPLQALIRSMGFQVSVDAKAALEWALGQQLPSDDSNRQWAGSIGLSATGKAITVLFPYNVLRIEKMQSIFGDVWRKNHQCWHAPIDSLEDIIETFPEFQVLPEVLELRAKAEPIWPVIECPDLDGPIAGERKLFKHQKQAVAIIVRERYSLLCDSMGLGKSLSALIAAKILSQGKLPIIIVCPASLKENWQEECDMAGVSATIVSWAVEIPRPDKEFILIADEHHYSKNSNSSRSKRFLEVALDANCSSMIGLTGTPIGNGRAMELLPLLKAARHPLGRKPKYFIERYCQGDEGLSNGDELHRRLTKNIEGDPLSKAVVIRRTKEILNLPEKKLVLKPIKMSPESLALYQKTFIELQSDYRKRVAEGKITGADALVLMMHLRHAGSLGKVEASIKMAKEYIAQGRQVVLFTEFKVPAKQIASALGAGMVTGDQDNKAIVIVKDKFQRGLLPALVCTFARGGVGHTFTAGSVVILVDRPWVVGNVEQAIDRLHRIGQLNAVLAILIQATATDVNVDEILLQKAQRINLVLRGQRKTLRGTGDLKDIAKEMAAMLWA